MNANVVENWMKLYNERSSSMKIYVTVGIAEGTAVKHILCDRLTVEVGRYPDTVMDSVKNLLNELSSKFAYLSYPFSHEGFVTNTDELTLKERLPEDILYFEVFRTHDPFEDPFLYSDNSPTASLMAEKKVKELKDASNKINESPK